MYDCHNKLLYSSFTITIIIMSCLRERERERERASNSKSISTNTLHSIFFCMKMGKNSPDKLPKMAMD
jgi:hypothetical protein